MKGSLFSLNAPGVFLPPSHQRAGVPPNFLLSLHFSSGLYPTPGPSTGLPGRGGSSEQAGRVGAPGIRATPSSCPGDQARWVCGPGSCRGEFFAHDHTSPARQLSAQDARDPGSLARVQMLLQSRHHHRG